MTSPVDEPAFDLLVETREGRADLSSVADRVAHLMISVKNRAFDAALFDHFCRLAGDHFAGGLLTVVDAPYIHNIRAESPDPAELERRLKALETLSRERTRCVHRAMRRSRAPRLRFLPWADLVAATPGWLFAEVRSAYDGHGRFRAAVAGQTLKMRGKGAGREHDAFLLDEIPPLLWAYYGLEEGVADVYPGPQMPFFWEIDRGGVASELPKVSAMAAAHRGHVYIELFSRGGRPAYV